MAPDPQTVTLALDDFPMSEIRNCNLDGIRRYATSVSDKGAYVAGSVLRFLADQIEAQTKPPRIPEPGKYAVVEASLTGDSRSEWVSEGKHWVGLDNTIVAEWDDLLAPTLVREGVDG